MISAKTKVVIVGPSLKTQGGITSVLSVYHSNFKEQFNMKFIGSYLGNGRIKDMAYFTGALTRVFWECLTNKKAVFHIHTASKGSYLRKSIIAKLCMRMKNRVILHIHGGKFDEFMDNSTPRKKEKIISLLNSAEKIVVLSETWRSYFSQYVPPKKLAVIYNPCSTMVEEYEERRNQKPNIVFLGKLCERKGIYDLIEAVKKISRSNFILNLYGDGEIEAVKKLIEKENLSHKIFVNGWVPHEIIADLYDAADILVLPSYVEGLPMVVLEAIGRGLPVVATNVGGTAEAVMDGESGFIINPGDVNDLAKKLEILINDADLRERMGRRSLEIAAKKFSINEIRRQLETLYRGVCNG